LITFSFDLAKSHVEAYLRVGNEKLELAMWLRKNKKYPMAITSYIESYEELGQALFLSDKISSSEEITENDWNKYIKPAPHSKKILAHHIIRKNQLNKSTSEEFKKIQQPEIGKNFPEISTREDTIEAIEELIAIYSKLHKIRQIFDYSHNLNGQIMKHDYDEKDLESLCHLLESECHISYYLVKMGLEYHGIELSTDPEEIAMSKIMSLPSTKKLIEISSRFNTVSGKELAQRGLDFIESF
jgi:hypothetical protein